MRKINDIRRSQCFCLDLWRKEPTQASNCSKLGDFVSNTGPPREEHTGFPLVNAARQCAGPAIQRIAQRKIYRKRKQTSRNHGFHTPK